MFMVIHMISIDKCSETKVCSYPITKRDKYSLAKHFLSAGTDGSFGLKELASTPGAGASGFVPGGFLQSQEQEQESSKMQASQEPLEAQALAWPLA